MSRALPRRLVAGRACWPGVAFETSPSLVENGVSPGRDHQEGALALVRGGVGGVQQLPDVRKRHNTQPAGFRGVTAAIQPIAKNLDQAFA